MSETITHITAGALCLAGRWVQRCGVCGAKLLDSLHTAAPLNPDGSEPEFPKWPPGRLLQQTVGENPTRWSLLEETDKLPPDSCVALIE